MEYTEWKAGHTDHALIPGVETLSELEIRVHELLAHVAIKYLGKRVLAVSHGAFIRKVVRVTSDKKLPLEGQRFSNASLSTFKLEGKRWKVLNFNPETLI
jgi:broad specificity phosphatase PhoE